MAKKVYINEPLTSRKIIEVLEKNPDIERIICPVSLYNRISTKYLEVLEELGIEVKPIKRVGRPPKYTEKDVKMVRRLLMEGKTPKQVSGITRIPLKSVYYLKGDLKLKRGPKPKYDKKTRAKIKEMAKKGVPPKKISEKFNIPLRTVYYILKR